MERFEPQRSRKEALFRHPKMATQELAALMPEDKRRLIEETALDAMTHLAEAGFREYDDIARLFRDVAGSGLIVRREDPARLLDAIVSHEPLHISFPDAKRYSNAVEWDPSFRMESMDNAFLEGYGMANGVVTVMGAQRSDELDVQKLPDAQRNFNGINRESVVSVQGDVPPDDIAFVILRVPIYGFPIELMTEHERDLQEEWEEAKLRAAGRVEPRFAYRGYLNPAHSRMRAH